MQSLALRYALWVVSHPWRVVILWLCVIAAAASGLRTLTINNNYRQFFSADNPELLEFNALENTFVKNDTLNFVVAPENARVFSRETLTLVADLTARAWQIPYVSRVDSLTNFQHTEAQGDELSVRDLVADASDLDDAALARVKAIALAEPLLHGVLVNERAQVTAINVVVQLPRLDEHLEVPQVVSAARALAKEFESANPGLKIYLTGAVMMDNAFAEESRKGIKSLIPISFALMVALVGVLFGHLIGALSTTLVIGLAIIVAMGLGSHLGYPISAATSAAPVVILTVAIANCVHVLEAYLQALHGGAARQEALIESVSHNLKPIFLASVTTVIGFLTFNFSEVPPFRQLGNLVAFGDIASYLLAISLLPAVLMLLPVGPAPRPLVKLTSLAALVEWVIARHRALALGLGLLVFGLILCIPRNTLNDVFVDYFDPSVDFRRATDFMVENLTGVYHFYYTLEAGLEGGINEPEFLRETAAFVTWLRAQPEVKHVASYTDIVQRLNMNMHDDDPAMYRLPEERELAAQYLLLYEMSLPYGLDLNNQINVDKSAVKVSVAMRTLSSKASIEFNDKAEAWVRANARSVTRVEGSGSALMFSRLGMRNIHSMLVGTVVALLLISGVLLFMLRSVKLGILSLIPNLVPLAMGFGLWGLFVGEVGLSLSVVASMALGIIIDDTVHFLVKYQRGRTVQGYSVEDAVRYAFRVNGRAMIVTTISLVAGFLVLTLSNFELNSSMGLLTAVVIGLALLADFFLLAPLLLLIDGRRHVA